MEFREVPIDRVLVNNRLRQPQEESIQALAESIESIGLLNPVVVKASTKTDSGTAEETFSMVAGVRRLLACKRLGHTLIPARIFQGTEIDDRLAEIDENLCRAELNELEKSEHLAERKELYEIRFPETQRGVAGANAANQVMGRKNNATDNLSFASYTGQKTGVSDRDIRRSIRRSEKIPNEVKDMIRGTEIANKGVELDALAKMDPKEQKAAVQAVIDGRSSTIREAASTLNAATDLQADEKTIDTTDIKQPDQSEKKDSSSATGTGHPTDQKKKATQTPPPKKGHSEKSIEKAVEAISSTAVPELINAVKSGKIKPVVAKRIVQLSQIEQRFFVDSAERGSNTLDSPKQAQERCSEGEVVYDRHGRRHVPEEHSLQEEEFNLERDFQLILEAETILSKMTTPPDILRFAKRNPEIIPEEVQEQIGILNSQHRLQRLRVNI